MAASPPAAADLSAYLSATNATILELATDAARTLLDQSTPAERQAQRKAELQRLVSAVKDAKKEVEAHQGAARHRGDVDAATRQHTLQVLASKVQDASAARKAFAKTLPGEPAFFAAALDAVRGHIPEEEELELTP